MRFCTEEEFGQLVRGLAERLRQETLSFVASKGVHRTGLPGLHQSSYDLNDVATELLTLGANIWPESSRDPSDPVVVRLMPASLLVAAG